MTNKEQNKFELFRAKNTIEDLIKDYNTEKELTQRIKINEHTMYYIRRRNQLTTAEKNQLIQEYLRRTR